MKARTKFRALGAITYATGLVAIWLSVTISSLFFALYILSALLISGLARRIRCDACGNRIFKHNQLTVAWMSKVCHTCHAQL